MRFHSIALGLGGGVVIVIALVFQLGDPTLRDLRHVTEPIHRQVPHGIENGESIAFDVKIPDDAIWRKVTIAWGHPRFAICGLDANGERIGSVDLRWLAEASQGTRLLPLKRAIGCAGHSFSADPGTTVNVRVTPMDRDPRPSATEFVVVADWHNMKDKQVGALIHDDVERYIAWVYALGGALVLTGALLAPKRRREVKR
jgi:hypothetical protein